ncbi:MAG: LD-carboxypeptidase [Alphaproteobacteria bacterium]|nr:LD-carboxypeptidase [Alphaproteobacteria bacterium]
MNQDNASFSVTLPRALIKGGTIGVFAPSSWVDAEDMERSSQHMENLGYKTFIHPQTYERKNQSAGNVLQKALAFQGLWQREDIDALWVAGGGNGCLHLLNALKFAPLKRGTPKPVIGFSDATALINALYAHTGITTFHGPVYKNLHKYNKEQMAHLLSLLGGKENVSYPLHTDTVLHEGKASGRLVGGNLSLFQYLPQTMPCNFCDKAILFLEDCNEEISRIDRMLMQLRRLGVFEKSSAIVFGEFTNLQDTGRPYGYTLEDIIREHIEGLDIPVLYNMPFGHDKNLYSFPIGASASIDTTDLSFKIEKSATI